MWLIDDAAYSVRISTGRPLRTAGAWELINRLSRSTAGRPTSPRTEARVEELRVSTDRLSQLSSWLRQRGRRLTFSASRADTRFNCCTIHA